MDASRFEVQQPKTMDIRQYLNARVGKMSYQSVNLDIEADVEPFEEPKRSHWKLYASIILMMAIGVVGYLLGKISKDDPAFQASMATSGKIAYSSLGPESKSYLFKQFVAKYGRKVPCPISLKLLQPFSTPLCKYEHSTVYRHHRRKPSVCAVP